jgi:hypothetical protein
MSARVVTTPWFTKNLAADGLDTLISWAAGELDERTGAMVPQPPAREQVNLTLRGIDRRTRVPVTRSLGRQRDPGGGRPSGDDGAAGFGARPVDEPWRVEVR